ncbi:MAG: thermonuclease family protein [Planctomycetota bacterium]|nr:thermonuclease family protein [Planctomycetota bacterium]
MMLSLLAIAALCVPVLPQNSQGPQRATDLEILQQCATEAPTELFEVTRVIDGDTIWIQRNGKREKLRLLSVDTEEKFMKGGDISEFKPCTRYGDECTGWAQGFFAPRSINEGPVKVGLRFPGGKEARDIYGRLLCQVVTSDGVDFNLLLVRRGMSPYFNKYGNSKISHEAFVAAQKAAKKEYLGIWNRRTNEMGKQRPYDRLLTWWDARAAAIDNFRAKAKAEPKAYMEGDDPDALEAALKSGSTKITVMGSVSKIFDEDDGSKTVLLRGGDKARAIRIRVEAKDLAAMQAMDLEGTMKEFRQNYLLFSGTLAQGKRSYELQGSHPSEWKLAGPEPKTN